jgi:hypothetical protein
MRIRGRPSPARHNDKNLPRARIRGLCIPPGNSRWAAFRGCKGREWRACRENHLPDAPHELTFQSGVLPLFSAEKSPLRGRTIKIILWKNDEGKIPEDPRRPCIYRCSRTVRSGARAGAAGEILPDHQKFFEKLLTFGVPVILFTSLAAHKAARAEVLNGPHRPVRSRSRRLNRCAVFEKNQQVSKKVLKNS